MGRILIVLLLAGGGVAQPLAGDCNGDGLGPDVVDALYAALMAVGRMAPTPAQELACDSDGSGSITSVDALTLAQEACRLIERVYVCLTDFTSPAASEVRVLHARTFQLEQQFVLAGELKATSNNMTVLRSRDRIYVSDSEGRSLRRLDTAAGVELPPLPVPGSPVLIIGSPDERYVCILTFEPGGDYELLTLDAATETLVESAPGQPRRLPFPGLWITCGPGLLPSGVLLHDFGGETRELDLATGAMTMSFTGPQIATCLSLDRSRLQLYMVAFPGALYRVDLTGVPLVIPDPQLPGNVYGACYHPVADRVYQWANLGYAHGWAPQIRLRETDPMTLAPGAELDLPFSDANELVAVGDNLVIASGEPDALVVVRVPALVQSLVIPVDPYDVTGLEAH